MKITGGYYIKARKIQESSIQRQPPYVREIWDWLLMNANHHDIRYNGFLVKRGQLFRSYQDIRDGLCWYVGYRKEMYNENQTKKAMKYLRDALMIASTKEPGGVLITILNYDKYQDPKNYEITSERTNERTNEELMKNQCIPDNNKNEKNEKNEKKKDIYDHFDDKPDWITDEELSSLIDYRKNHKKKLPISKLAFNGLFRELKKARDNGLTVTECLEAMASSGWQGFKAEWMDTGPHKSRISDDEERAIGILKRMI